MSSRNLLFNGPTVTLAEMLAAKEQRVVIQEKLLHRAPQHALLSATMTIPGAVKTSAALTNCFENVLQSVQEATNDAPVFHKVYQGKKTGLEYYALFPLSGTTLKKRMITIENTHPYGRLVDLDVLSLNAQIIQTISRKALDYPPRTCFICQKEAKICARSKAHSAQDIQNKLLEIVKERRRQTHE